MCVCRDSYYDKDGGCELCEGPIPGCVKCSDDKTCTACKNEGNFNPDPVKNVCVCNARWILDEKVCKSC